MYTSLYLKHSCTIRCNYSGCVLHVVTSLNSESTLLHYAYIVSSLRTTTLCLYELYFPKKEAADNTTTHDHAQSYYCVAPHKRKKVPARPGMNHYALILLAAHAKYGSSVWKKNYLINFIV